MDINDRDSAFEKRQKEDKLLKESWSKGMMPHFGKPSLLNEDAFAVGKKLTSGQAGKKHDKKGPVTKLEEVVDTEDKVEDGQPPVEPGTEDGGAPPLDDKPTDSSLTPPPSGDAPAPVATDTPEGGNLNSEGQLATQNFVTAYLKGLPSDVDMKTATDSNGIFKVSVNDQQNGQFMVVAFPATKNIHQVADLLEPVQGGIVGGENPEGNGMPPVDGAMPPAEGGAVPPVAGDGAGVPPAVPGEVPPPTPAPVPAEGGSTVPPKPEEEEPLKEEAECKDKNCTDPHCKVHGHDASVMKESEREKARDPLISGRKDWKSFIGKMLRESTELVSKKKELEEAIKCVGDKCKVEKDPAKKKELEAELKAKKDELLKCKDKNCSDD